MTEVFREAGAYNWMNKSEKRRLASTGTGGHIDKGASFAPFRNDRSIPRGWRLQLDEQK
ncbi:hypothetical protein [Sporosarcina sp. GW1-11]|uniref:hypothetical protein n=1 Tax=Sporosarcina sp. GW1-11 TaxID=2899126 RepID=UPI0029543392|nr:hypothetical protein [Sporosarcina sp. GW1-11]